MSLRINSAYRTILSIVIVVTIVNSVDVFANGIVSKPPHIKLLYKRNNIEELKDPKRFYYFLRADNNYIRKADNETLYREIAFLDQYVFDAKKSFDKSNKNMIIYLPNSVGNVLVCESASRNRRRLIESRIEGSNFDYERGVFRYPKKTIKIVLSDIIDIKDLTIAYEEVKNVVNSHIFDKNLLEDIIVSLSPFKMDGINGFTETYGLNDDGISVVIGVKKDSMTEKEFRESVRSTILHELGHVFHEKSSIKGGKFNLNNKFWKDYISYYEDEDLDFYYKDEKTEDNWRRDIRENLAEDFKIYYSSQLGEYSFEPEDKHTGIKYNPEIAEFFDKYISKEFESRPVCIRHSTVKTSDKLLTLYKQGIVEVENTNGLEVRVQTKEGTHCEGSYIGMWEKGEINKPHKVYIKDNEDTVINIDKDSDITSLIKYELINNKYEPIWRLNIK